MGPFHGESVYVAIVKSTKKVYKNAVYYKDGEGKYLCERFYFNFTFILFYIIFISLE
jgi:hypothetical protein